MRNTLDNPPGFDDAYSRDDIIIMERPPSSPWGAILAFIVIMAIVVTGLILFANTTEPVPTTVTSMVG